MFCFQIPITIKKTSIVAATLHTIERNRVIYPNAGVLCNPAGGRIYVWTGGVIYSSALILRASFILIWTHLGKKEQLFAALGRFWRGVGLPRSPQSYYFKSW